MINKTFTDVVSVASVAHVACYGMTCRDNTSRGSAAARAVMTFLPIYAQADGVLILSCSLP